MDLINSPERLETLKLRFEEQICYLQIHRPESNNTISDGLIAEMSEALRQCEGRAKIVVLEGLAEIFCFGADFDELRQRFEVAGGGAPDPGPLYDLWALLATGPFLSIAHVRGKANAGGIGFVAACDIVLSEEAAVFSLSELLFGLMPACVLPFLIRRIGAAKANYMTLMTQPISARQALEWGLVDAVETDSASLLRKHLLRLRRLDKAGISRYKRYMNNLDSQLLDARPRALAANVEVFSDRENLAKIARYVKTGQFPWEGG